MSAVPGEEDRKLSSEEYARRKRFLDHISSLSKPEHIEIVRILKKHEVIYSENHNGIFFNVAHLTQTVFDELETFLLFTQTNRHSLSDRDSILSTLKHVKNEDSI